MAPSRLSATLPSAIAATMPGYEPTGDAERRAPSSGAINASGSAGEQPVRRRLREQQPRERLAGERVLLERAVVRVIAKQEFEREQRCKQRADPHDAGRDLAQLRELRRDGERKQRGHDGEEHQRLQQLARPAKREVQVARKDESRRIEHRSVACALMPPPDRACAQAATARTSS